MTIIYTGLLVALALFIALPPLYVLASYCMLFYEKKLDGRLRLVADLPPPALTIKLLQIMAAEICALWLTIFLWLIFGALKRPRKTNSSAGSNKPILLIHGYWHNQTGWFLFRRHLVRAGFGPIYSLNLFPVSSSIEHFGNQVAVLVEQIRKTTGSKELALIGHSMGGLVAAYYAERLAPPRQVTDIITLGTPFGGTRRAALGKGVCVEQMLPNSPFLADLSYWIQRGNGTCYYHIGAEWDGIIVPACSAFSGNPKASCIWLQNEGHMGLLYSPAATRQVIAWLLLCKK